MTPNQQQVEAWNGGESTHYVDHADRYDRQLAPFTDALLDRARLEPHHAVLDVGCGCGATTLAAARVAGRVLGVDLSAPLLDVARSRARAASLDRAEFVVTDAQTHDVGDGAFDVVISQFGLMFFDDVVAAFTNLRRALRPGGHLVAVTWQELDANEWLTVVARVVAAHVALPRFGGLGGGPGMFALQDPTETTDLLRSVGFDDIAVEPLTPEIVLGGGGTLDESIDFLLGTGMVRGLLGRIEAPEEREAATDAVRAELTERYQPATGIRLGAAGWLVSAAAP